MVRKHNTERMVAQPATQNVIKNTANTKGVFPETLTKWNLVDIWPTDPRQPTATDVYGLPDISKRLSDSTVSEDYQPESNSLIPGMVNYYISFTFTADTKSNLITTNTNCVIRVTPIVGVGNPVELVGDALQEHLADVGNNDWTYHIIDIISISRL